MLMDLWKLRKIENRHLAMNGNSPMLVNVAQQIETPKEVTLEGRGIPSTIRLKSFNDLDCACGYSRGIPVESLPDFLVGGDVPFKNGELGSLWIGTRQSCQRPHQLVKRGAQAIE